MSGTTKLSISFPSELAERVRDLARDEADGNVSAWLAVVAEREVRRAQARASVAEYEAEHGLITDDELAQARERWLG